MSIIATSRLLDLSGKVAIVTGAARGIGEGIAARLADAGAKVVVCDINEAGAVETERKIAAGGGEALAVSVDLTQSADIDRLVKKTVAHFEGVDILVNNAGLRDSFTWDRLAEADWDRFMAVNAKAVFFLSQAVARQMVLQKRGGAIVNIASTAAMVPVPWKVDYNTAKAGVVNMSKSLAKELGEHMIRVNAVGPGGVNTPGGAGTTPANIPGEMVKRMGETYRARLALPVDLLEPDDIARAVLFLSSDASRYITGQTIYVDAGYLVG